MHKAPAAVRGRLLQEEDRIGTFTGISLECDEELSAKGVVFAKPPKSEPWGVMAILQDSEGNQLVLSTGR